MHPSLTWVQYTIYGSKLPGPNKMVRAFWTVQIGRCPMSWTTATLNKFESDSFTFEIISSVVPSKTVTFISSKNFPLWNLFFVSRLFVCDKNCYVTVGHSECRVESFNLKRTLLFLLCLIKEQTHCLAWKVFFINSLLMMTSTRSLVSSVGRALDF